MARETYVLRGGKLVPKREAPPAVDAPYVLRDAFNDPLWHPATGQLIASKSEFRRATRAAGCEEVGDMPQRDTRAPLDSTPSHYRDAVGYAINKLKNGYKPAEHGGRED